MKKTIDIILIIVIFLIIYFMQSNFFTWFNIAGIKPNLFVILIAIIGLFLKEHMGLIFGMSLGLLLDFFVGPKIGIYAISLSAVGFLAGKLDRNFSKNSKITLMGIMAFLTLFFEAIVCIMYSISNGFQFQFMDLIKTVFLEIIYNVLLTIALYPFIFKFGENLENDFSNNNFMRFFG